eukprot:338723-Pelagomonas_calceolata.AAC.9
MRGSMSTFTHSIVGGYMRAGAARPIFPFTAIVGQEEMKLSLILNVIDPKIGGVMIMGDRGTGKSTTIRALADLLPEIQPVHVSPWVLGKSNPGSDSKTTAHGKSTTRILFNLSHLPMRQCCPFHPSHA